MSSSTGTTLAGEADKAPAPEDRYLWLEEVSGDKPLEWAKARNAESAKVLVTPEEAALEKRILDILDSKERIPNVQKLGPWYYNFWRDAKNPRGLWRRTTLAEYKKPEPAWETVIDVDALGAAEKENWFWHGADCLRPEYKRCIVQLSRGGADADVVREFDLVAKTFLKDGFYLPESKNSVSWLDADRLYVGTDFGKGSMTTSGYPRVAKLWKRGTPIEQAETLYEGKAEDVAVAAFRDHTKGFERDFVNRAVTFYSDELFVRRDGKLVKIDKPDSANANVHRDLLLLELRDEWAVAGRTYPAGALLAADFEGFLKGERRFDVLFEPTDRRSMQGYSPTLHYILVNELDNVKNRVYVLGRKDGKWTREPLPGMPEFGTVTATAVDDEESDDYFMTVADYVTPTSLSLGAVGKGSAEKLKQLPAFFDTTGLLVSQHETASKDGTRIPYFQVARKTLALDGKNPTLLYGYGGFEISMLPGYSAGVGAAWLEKGGVYVVANIRGGGEFGPKWHQAALKAGRNKAYEDFIAVGEDLIRRKVTSTPHLGIQGGSNGGLLMGNMLTMRPDLWGAVVCQVPLLDMRRYHTLLAGASWMGEYGNPDDPKEWAFLEGYSPYHQLKPGVKYPPTLFTTSTRDDRVHPGHARKMMARMGEMGQDVLYYENIEGGHGGAANNQQAAHMAALAYTFLWQKLGMLQKGPEPSKQ
ncbi:MAG TPA: prolyl oligopeptidase family serine peptidase [Vicinamibacteria bacterium]